MRTPILFFILAALATTSCDIPKETFSDPKMWCSLPDRYAENVDVFYVVSTNIMRSFNPDGTESFSAVLNDEEKAILATEIKYIENNLFPEKVNFFSPYYHQTTMSALANPAFTRKDLQDLSNRATNEVFDAFDYYMEHFNQDRPFIIAGYSQGAIMTKNLLQHLTAEQSKRLVAAYMMGYGLDAETLQHANVNAATGATDTGVTISFTSMANTEAIYNIIYNDAVECINPVNWCTDATPAEFQYDGETLTVHVDQTKKVLIVDGFHYEKHKTQDWSINPWSKDNYHNFEIYFYAPQIRKNALDRISHYLK